MGITHFFFIKKDKRGLWDVVSFGLCIISIILIPIETFGKQKLTSDQSINFVIGMILGCLSGCNLSLVS